jgi:release factor glutamine methyltransferase
MTLSDLFQSLSNQLLVLYSKQESESLVIWLFEEYLGKSRKDLSDNIVLDSLPRNLKTPVKNFLKVNRSNMSLERPLFMEENFPSTPMS